MRQICVKFWQYYKGSFTWRQQKHFWPVYLYWGILLSHLYVSLWILVTFLDPADEITQLFAVHNHYYARFRDVSTAFLTLLTFLFVPYELLMKQWVRAGQYAVYYICIYYSYPYFWDFANFCYSLIFESIMCPATGVQASFC